MLCDLMEVLSHADAKKKMHKNFKFHTFIGRFSRDILAVKGLWGDWPVKFGPKMFQNMFVFFSLQVLVPEHGYFSSKSVFL